MKKCLNPFLLLVIMLELLDFIYKFKGLQVVFGRQFFS